MPYPEKYFYQYHLKDVEIKADDGYTHSGFAYIITRLVAQEEYELPEGFIEFDDGIIVFFSEIESIRLL